MLDLDGYDGFKFKNQEMMKVFEAVYDFAHNGSPIIMFGPSGAGKEYIARYYFEQYKKASNCTGKFISVNCSQLVRETTQSVLFGHLKGSFTDAKYRLLGQFELAENGVLFLDEIGTLEKSVQAMVNRAMDDPFEALRFGDTKPYSTRNVRVICATENPKKDLNDSLLYRSGLQINVPGLDDRDEDVDEAIKHFSLLAIDKRLDVDHVLFKLLNRRRKEFGKDLSKEEDLEEFGGKMAALLAPFVRQRDWPGNFRALRAAVDSGVIRAKRLSSEEAFIDDVNKYFHQHLGNYSIAEKQGPSPSPDAGPLTTDPEVSKWMEVLSEMKFNLGHEKKLRLSQFLSEFEDTPFLRKVFDKYMDFETRISQYVIKELREDMKILEFVPGKGFRYQVSKKFKKLIKQSINVSHFMELPDSEQDEFMTEKKKEALDLINNSRGLFISEEEPERREKFLGMLGRSLQENYDVIYYSFKGHSLDEFISACIEHLESLDMHGWFSEQKDDGLDQNEKLSGLSGHMVQSLSRHRRTFIILEGIDTFNTSSKQSLIETLIYYWNPIHFILGSSKQFLPQHLSRYMGLSELNLSD